MDTSERGAEEATFTVTVSSFYNNGTHNNKQRKKGLVVHHNLNQPAISQLNSYIALQNFCTLIDESIEAR